jgi:hypothetical protein
MAISCSRRVSTRATNPLKWAALSGMLGKVALAFLALTLCFSAPAVAQKKPKLEKTFSDWLNRDVVYIITKDERDDFLKLTTDEARDKFIEQFWEIRNPDPGSPTNSYKDDIYKRIAFTNARFGIARIAVVPTSPSANPSKNRSSATPATCIPSRSGSTAT